MPRTFSFLHSTFPSLYTWMPVTLLLVLLLQQFQQGGILHPVCYYSYKLKEYQKSTVEKEALSLVLSLEHFDVYLGYSPRVVNIYCDHNPLTFINSMNSKNARILSWALKIQPYQISVFHIKDLVMC